MTRELRDRTLGELEELTPEGQREMTAARLTLKAVALLNEAQEASGLNQRQLADALGVSEGRVSQVLGGDGNIRISTFARYLRAMGYVPRLETDPASDAVPPLGGRRVPRRRRSMGSHSTIHFAPVEHNGTSGVKTILMSAGMPLSATETSTPQFVGWLNHEHTTVAWSKPPANELDR